MAEDLAPRPSAYAADDEGVTTRGSETLDPRRAPAEPRPFRYRFGIAYVVLALVAGVALGAAYLMIEREPTQEARWSEWKPSGRESTYPSQIAQAVGVRYRNPSGTPLVSVIASPPEIETGEGVLPIRYAVFRHSPALSGAPADFEPVPINDGAVMYTLCGAGDRCSIAEDEPSAERGQLLRREALELALYTFKYVDGAQTVLVLVPPNLGDADDPNDDRQSAVFLRKRDFDRQLAAPVERTLVDRSPEQTAPIARAEQRTVDALTLDSTFLYQFQPAPTGGGLIILQPIPPGP